MTRIRIHALAFAIVAAGCSSESATTGPGAFSAGDVMPFETAISAPRLSTSYAPVVATVGTSSGGSVEFLDIGDGQVAVAERAPRHARFVVFGLLATRDATPLELFRALERSAAAPTTLLRDHERRAKATRRASMAPNDIDMIAADLQDPGREPYICDAFGDQWIADWVNGFAGITKYRAATYRHFKSGSYTFYPGAGVYYGTSTNSVTYLGACNGDEHDDLTFEVHRRIGGAWVNVHQVDIAGYEKYTFYSPIPAGYRGRVRGAGGATIEHYGVGAAWTISRGEAIP